MRLKDGRLKDGRLKGGRLKEREDTTTESVDIEELREEARIFREVRELGLPELEIVEIGTRVRWLCIWLSRLQEKNSLPR